MSVETGFLIGAWAFLWCRVLITAGHLFWFVPSIVQMVLPNGWFGEKLERVMIGCPVCHAGQIAVWCCVYSGRLNVGLIISAMLTAWFFDRLNEWFDKQ